MPSGLRQLIVWLGPLRLLLVLGALMLLLLRPAPGTPPVYAGWDILPTLILPVLMPIFFMVLLLDAILGTVLLASYPGERRRYRIVIGVDLVMALLLILRWWAYFGALST